MTDEIQSIFELPTAGLTDAQLAAWDAEFAAAVSAAKPAGPGSGKVYRGVITNWQLHRFKSISWEAIRNVNTLLKVSEGLESILPCTITGTTRRDPTGRFKTGNHCRLSPLTYLDEKTGYIETRNSIYELEGPGESDSLPDMGVLAMYIYY